MIDPPLVTPTNERIAYWLALGIFVHQFAHVETTLWFLLAKLAGVNWPTARALFSGVHINGQCQFIKRLLDVNNANQATKDDWKSISEQLDHITKARNSILHYGTTFSENEDDFQSSNILVALTESHVKSFPVSKDILNAMVSDLKIISAHLLAYLHQGQIPPRATWQYIPPPDRQHQRRQPKHRASNKGPTPTSPPKA